MSGFAWPSPELEALHGEALALYRRRLERIRQRVAEALLPASNEPEKQEEGSVELPGRLGELLFQAAGRRLVKAAGHKYIRRVPTGNPRKPWRYYYKVTGGRGLGHADEFQAGAKFKLKHKGKDGHFEVVSRDGDQLRIKHDETGEEETVTAEALAALLHQEHVEPKGEKPAEGGEGEKSAEEGGEKPATEGGEGEKPATEGGEGEKPTEGEKGAGDKPKEKGKRARLKRKVPLKVLRKANRQTVARVTEKLAFEQKERSVAQWALDILRAFVGWVLSRKGWSAEGRAALLAETVKGANHDELQARGEAAERLADGEPVTAEHVRAAEAEVAKPDGEAEPEGEANADAKPEGEPEADAKPEAPLKKSQNMEELQLPRLLGALVYHAAEGLLIKGAGHKYVRRVPTGNPRRPWRYFYTVAGGHGLGHADELQAGAKFKVKHQGKDGHFEVVAHEGGKLRIKHDETGHEELVSHEALKALLHQEHAEAVKAHHEKTTERTAKRYASALADVPREHLEDLKGSDEERAKLLREREPKVFERLLKACKAQGKEVDPYALRRAVSWVLDRKGWSPEGRSALLDESTVGPKADYVAKNLRRLGEAAENLAGGAEVTAAHVEEAVELPAPAAMTPVLSEAEKDLAKGLWGTQAEEVALKLAKAFPGMALDQVVSLVLGKQAAEEAKTHKTPTREGAPTSVFLPGEDGRPQRLDARFKLVEASELVASHNPEGFARRPDYPESLQERAYHRDKAEQAKVLRNAEHLIPEYVANTNPDAVNGTPLVDDNGVVLGGNSRTMSMQLAYKRGEADALKAHLEKNAATFGFRPEDVQALKNPVLVRVVDTARHDPKLLVRQMNEAMTQDMDPRVLQVALGRKVDDRTLETLAQDMQADETLDAFLDTPRATSFINQLRRVGVIDARNQSRYMKDGRLNEDGKTLVERVLVGKVVADPDLLSDTPPSLVSSLARAVPYMVQAEAHGEGYSLRADLKEALEAHNDIKRRGLKGEQGITDYLRNMTLLGSGNELKASDHPLNRNKRARSLLSVLMTRSGPRQLAEVFRAHAAQAAENPEGQSSLFGPGPSPAEVFEQAVKLAGRMEKSLGRRFAWDAAEFHSERDELPRLLGALVWASQLHKGAGHKYIRRVPTGDAKRPWRYFYTVAGGHGLGHTEEMKIGAAFRVKHQGKDGHFHIVGEEGGQLRIKHDETGHEETLSREALSALLRGEHAEAINAHRAKLKRELDAVKAHGSDKQKARIEAEAKRAGVERQFTPRERTLRTWAENMGLDPDTHSDAIDRALKDLESKGKKLTDKDLLQQREDVVGTLSAAYDENLSAFWRPWRLASVKDQSDLANTGEGRVKLAALNALIKLREAAKDEAKATRQKAKEEAAHEARKKAIYIDGFASWAHSYFDVERTNKGFKLTSKAQGHGYGARSWDKPITFEISFAEVDTEAGYKRVVRQITPDHLR